MSGRRNQSVVWEVFEKPVDGQVICRKCSFSYKYTGNTSTMMTHLKNKHAAEFLESKHDRQQIADMNSTSPIHEKNSPVHKKNSASRSSTNRIEDITCTPDVPLEPPRKRFRQDHLVAPIKPIQQSGDNALLDFIIMDLQPTQIVENEGFRKYSQALNPDYEIPCRTKLTQLVDDRYNIESEIMKEELNNVDYVAVTSDIWTLDKDKCFISLTAHYIVNVTFKSLVISTFELEDNYTAENIADAMQRILDDWKIGVKVVSIVTDNCSSTKKAVSEFLCKRHQFCLAHTLNLAVKDCIKKEIPFKNKIRKFEPVPDLLYKCRGIVSHFKHNTKSLYALKDMQTNIQMNTLKLKQDVLTCWNSTFYMLERLLKMKVPLMATLPLQESPLSNLDSNDWILIEDVVTLLRPFEKVTAILSGETYPSLSCVVPLVLGLQKVIVNRSPTTEAGKELQNKLLNVAEKILTEYECNRTAAKATFLDPRFKTKGFGQEVNAANAQKWVIDELKENLINSLPTSSLPNSTTETASVQDEDEIWGILDRKISETATQMTPSSSAASLVKQYVDLPYVDRKNNPLQFWEEKKIIFPSLYKMARKYLCIPATSVPSARVFSKAGLLYNVRRNVLALEKVDEILFLNSCKKV